MDLQVVRHIYRYAHYDEFGSDASRGDESSMQWLESGDEGYKTDEFDEKVRCPDRTELESRQ
ncbi:MAG: hypothetical protein Aurels2KO_58140 [Aureliella sp.]